MIYNYKFKYIYDDIVPKACEFASMVNLINELDDDKLTNYVSFILPKNFKNVSLASLVIRKALNEHLIGSLTFEPNSNKFTEVEPTLYHGSDGDDISIELYKLTDKIVTFKIVLIL